MVVLAVSNHAFSQSPFFQPSDTILVDSLNLKKKSFPRVTERRQMYFILEMIWWKIVFWDHGQCSALNYG